MEGGGEVAAGAERLPERVDAGAGVAAVAGNPSLSQERTRAYFPYQASLVSRYRWNLEGIEPT